MRRRGRLSSRYQEVRERSARIDIPEELLADVVGAAARWRRTGFGQWQRWSYLGSEWEDADPPPILVARATGDPAIAEWMVKADGSAEPYVPPTERAPEPPLEPAGAHSEPSESPGEPAAAPQPGAFVPAVGARDIVAASSINGDARRLQAPTLVADLVWSVAACAAIVFGTYTLLWMLTVALAAISSIFVPWLFDTPVAAMPYDGFVVVDLGLASLALALVTTYAKRFWRRELPAPRDWLAAGAIVLSTIALGMFAILMTGRQP